MNGPRDLVISASRTKDLVRCNPGPLAEVLAGTRPIRFGLSPQSAPLDVSALGALVLWTCDPGNLCGHAALNAQLRRLVDSGVVLALHLTVTGFNGTAIEPGVPQAQQVVESMGRALQDGLIRPAAVTLRFDPFAAFRLPDGRVLSNASAEAFERVLDCFAGLNIKRIVTSQLDVVHYPHVVERLNRLGISVLDLDVATLVLQFDQITRARGLEFSVCCSPALPALSQRFGCIDGCRLNALAEPGRVGPFTEELHNSIGKQRPECCCTYSRDIGHSSGFRQCFSTGSGCLYCYAQRGLPTEIERIARRLLGS